MIHIPDNGVDIDLTATSYERTRREDGKVTLVFYQIKALPIYEVRITLMREQYKHMALDVIDDSELLQMVIEEAAIK